MTPYLEEFRQAIRSHIAWTSFPAGPNYPIPHHLPAHYTIDHIRNNETYRTIIQKLHRSRNRKYPKTGAKQKVSFTPARSDYPTSPSTPPVSLCHTVHLRWVQKSSSQCDISERFLEHVRDGTGTYGTSSTKLCDDEQSQPRSRHRSGFQHLRFNTSGSNM